MKRRITLVVDDDMWFKARGARFDPRWSRSEGVTVESDVPIPDPDRVQEFRVRVVTKATDEAIIRAHLGMAVQCKDCYLPGSAHVTVTEVAPTEVPA